MKIEPLVSVLMTSYNREKYINLAIESVLASTYTNLELIIVDDGSKDNTLSIARSFEQSDDRVRVYVNEKNLGDYPNRNKAASYARGKYLKYVDADDLIYAHGLAVLVNSMEQFPAAGWGLCSLEQNVNRIFPFLLEPKEAYEYHYNGPGLFHKAPLSAIISKDLFEASGGFKPIRMAGDTEMWHRLAQKHPVVLMPQGLVWYRMHDEQEMNSYSQFKNIYRSITNDYLTAKACPLDDNLRLQLLRQQKKRIFRDSLRAVTRFQFKQFRQEFKYYQRF